MARVRLEYRHKDHRGNTVVNTKAMIYEPETDNQVTAYAASSGGSALTQPIEADDQGYIVAWLDEAQDIELVVTDDTDWRLHEVDDRPFIPESDLEGQDDSATYAAMDATELLRTTPLRAPFQSDPPGGYLLDDFDDVAAWTINAGTGTQAQDTTDSAHGTGYGMLVTTAAGATQTITRELQLDARDGWFGFWVKPGSNLSRLSLYLVVNGRSYSTKRYETAVVRTLHTAGRWKYVAVPVSQFTAAGTATDAMLADVRQVRFDVVPTSGNVATVLIKDFRFFPNTLPPGIVWYFDDARSDTYSNVFPLFAAKGWTGCIPTPTNLVGTSGKMTLLQCQEMHAAGWDFASHSHTHPATMAGMSTANIDTELQSSWNYLQANGLPRGSNHFVYPAGGWDATVLQRTGRQYRSARSYDSTINPTFVPAGFGNLDRVLIGETHGQSVAVMQGFIDRLVARGGIMPVAWHSIVASPAGGDSSQYSLADFTTIIDYAEAQGLAAYRPSDLGWG